MIIKFPAWRRTVFRLRFWAGRRRPIVGLVVPAVAGLALGVVGFITLEGGGGVTLALAQNQPRGIPVRVIDGDTIENTATGERIRLPNIDTPETGDRAQCQAEAQAGARATREARSIVRGATVTVRPTGRQDRYGRTIGFVIVDGRDLGEIMMERRLARPWRGRREPWCAADGRLLP